MTTKVKAAAETAPAPEAPKSGFEVVSNNKFEIVDNTAEKPVEEKPVETESYELLNGLVQVNYL